MTQVYTDDEAKELIKTIKQKEPEFNLSAFLKASLLRYTGEGQGNLAVLYKQFLDNKTRIEYLTNENLFLDEQIKELQEKDEVKKKEEEEQLAYKNELQEIARWFSSLSDAEKQAYKDGVANNKWGSTRQFYEVMHG